MKYQRVTEILYPFSGMKYVKAEVLENAAARGTKVHKICEEIARGLDGWEVPEDVRGYVDSFKKWWGNGKDVVEIEKRFFCDKLEITGQVDFVIREPDGDIIVDIKTSQRESKSWLLQGSAYSYMAKEQGYNIVGIMFLKVERDGSAPKCFLYNENMELFRKTLDVYRYFFGNKPRKQRKKTS